MKKVSRDEYTKYLVNNNLRDHPVEGHTVAVMQWLDGEGRIAAQAVYSRPVDIPGVKVNVTYEVAE